MGSRVIMPLNTDWKLKSFDPHMLYGGNQAYLPMNPWFDVANHGYVIGQFVWSGIDYLGETSYPSKGWSSGLIDTCGFRKPVPISNKVYGQISLLCT
ncbi:hypothetical protein [Paenibacillus maysiensis]|uniref:hypothetical protein n=1 Tax=Paenibacillus maysiensis TaxID=1155954 RepID=UPI000472305A|nr:hypothetical protein [Paenibacillus maysiensis]